MILINKKRIIFLITCILVGIFACYIQQFDEKTIQTVSLPCSNNLKIQVVVEITLLQEAISYNVSISFSSTSGTKAFFFKLIVPYFYKFVNIK